MIHELKTDPEVFEDTNSGRKVFEMRFNDRNFQVGDELILKETKYSGAEMAVGKPLEYTGRVCAVLVSYVMRGPCYGLKDGWVIMS